MTKLRIPLGRGSSPVIPAPETDYTADLLAELADVELADTSGATALGHQADELAAEQADLYRAAGTTAARAAVVAAAESQVPAQVAESHVDHAAGMVDAAVRHAVATRSALSRYVQRPPSAKAFYLIVLVVLAGGDMAAAAGAYVLLGEIPALAILLACATGMAAVIGGKAGADAKHNKLARQRQQRSDSLPAEVQPWEHMFRGADAGKKTVRLMAGVSGAIIMALTGSIFALRVSLDGLLAGLAFGLAALAISLGSVINSYIYADDIADIIDAADKAVAKTAWQQSRFARIAAIRQWRGSLATAASHRDENAALGHGAAHRVQAARYSVLVRTPDLRGESSALAPVGPDEKSTEPEAIRSELAHGGRTPFRLPIHPVNGVEPDAAPAEDINMEVL
ncbi:MAG TPA: hypothetical protein PKC31_00870 [Candidatus Nanoperiomorbaceae bacterium]|nr:hypothetical protein [Candidatus Nanoperiomorbaceae bacterium]